MKCGPKQELCVIYFQSVNVQRFSGQKVAVLLWVHTHCVIEAKIGWGTSEERPTLCLPQGGTRFGEISGYKLTGEGSHISVWL